MACSITRLDSNGSPTTDQIFSDIIQYTKQSIAAGVDPDPKVMIDNLKKVGYLSPTGQVGWNKLEAVSLFAELNGFFQLAFGSQNIPFIIRGKVKNRFSAMDPGRKQFFTDTAYSNTNVNRAQEYYLTINEAGLTNLSDRTGLKFADSNVKDTFTYDVFETIIGQNYEGVQGKYNLLPPLVDNRPYPYAAVAVTAQTAEMIKGVSDRSSAGQLKIEFPEGRIESESKELSLGEEAATPKDIASQVAFFQSAFRAADIEVVFEYDVNLPEKGKIISEAGKPVKIILNPMTMTADTHIHEFGHLLVELLGASHPAVKSAIEELRDTNLYKDVQAAYPELSGESLDKEVVVTAIGLAGAKINRTKPNLFQRIVNKILRALSRNLNTSETAVEKLAQTLLKGQFESLLYKKSVGYFTSKSKARNEKLAGEFSLLLDEVRIALTERIRKLERTSVELNESEIAKLEILKEGLNKVTTIEQLSNFLDYSIGLADRAEFSLEEIDRLYSEDLSEDERLQLLNKLQKIGEDVKEFYGGNDPEKSLISKMTNLVYEKNKILKQGMTIEQIEASPRIKALSLIEQRLMIATAKMGSVSKKYNDVGIPMIADLYMPYVDTDFEAELDVLINNIKTNNRTIALQKDNEYYELQKQFADKKLTKEELRAEELKLNIQQLENKKIGRQTLINELKEAQKDKSAFSLLADPLVHSSQVSLQLFSILLKNKFYDANDKTRDTITIIGEALKKYSEAKGVPVDVAKFYADIIEEHEYYDYDKSTGKNRVMKVATFVQELDVTRYKKAEVSMYRTLKEKYGKPDKGTPELKAWKGTPAAKAYYEEVAQWYKENSEETPEAKRDLERLNNKLKEYTKLYAAAEKTNNAERMAYFLQEIDATSATINLIYDKAKKQFKNSAVKPKASIYGNPKYAQLKANTAAFEFYQTVVGEYHKSQKKLGRTNQVKNSWEKVSYALPSIESDSLQKVQQNGAIDATKMIAGENFQFLSTDTNYGDLINANRENRGKHIPIFYTAPLESNRTSKDVASSVIMFAGMANMFEAKSDLHGAVTVMRDAMQKNEALEVNASNNPIGHYLNKILKNKLYAKKEGASNNYKHLNEFIDTIFYGEEDLGRNFTFLGKEFNTTKLARKTASYIAMDNLAFNFLQIGNQFILDNIRLLEESAAGQFMSMKDLAWAKKEFWLAFEGFKQATDFGKITPKTKIVQAIEYFDGLQEVLNIANAKETSPGVFKLAKESLMAGQQLVENETAVTRMLGLLHSYKGKLLDKDGKVIQNENGQPAHLWELFVKNEKTGQFEIDERVANRDKIRRQVTQRISGLTKKTNQIKNKFDDATIQRRDYGKLIMLFRRYFMPSLRRYWGHQGLGGGIHRDMEMGVLSEGIIHSSVRLLRDTFKKNGNIVGAYTMMTPLEKENVKRAAIQGAFFIAASALIMGLTGDDDEELTGGEEFMLYQALRLQSELGQFLNPKEFFKMVESPTAAIRTVKNVADLLDHIATEQVPYLLTGDDDGLYYERRSGVHEKGDSKFVAKFEKLIPILNGIEKSRDPKEAASWFTKD
jgi:hypothetical protein